LEYTGWLRDRRYLRPPSFEPSDEQLLAFETRVRVRIMTREKKSRLAGAGPFV